MPTPAPAPTAAPAATTATITSSTFPVSTPATILRLVLLLLLHDLDNLFGNSKVLDLWGISWVCAMIRPIEEGGRGTLAEPTYVISSDVDLGESEKSIAFRAGLNHLFQDQVHPVVAIGQMSVQRFAVLEFHQHRVALGGRE